MGIADRDAESCNSATAESSPAAEKKQHRKLDVYNDVLNRLADSNEARGPNFADELWHHFNRLPARYAMDVNVDRAEHVLVHKQLLKEAVNPDKRPIFNIEIVQGPSVAPPDSNSSETQLSPRQSEHPFPMFGSSTNLQALDRDSNNSYFEDGVSKENLLPPRPMYEVTFATDDRPKLLNQLTSLLGEINLNIEEAHAFTTNDGYSLDVFVVEAPQYKGTKEIRDALEKEIHMIEKKPYSGPHSLTTILQQAQSTGNSETDNVQKPTDGDDWEINFRQLNLGKKIASASYGDLYRGTYYNQDVAIKLLNPDRMNTEMLREFGQEVFIMRKVRHKNVVQFLGACTRPPNLCIVTEFMSGGSVFDFLHKRKGSFTSRTLLKAAVDICKGMDYLHQNNIIHRDLKSANLLMDENEVIKVADFGVARVKSQSGIMTAETGTYRWMAPEVIEHRPYDHKADVFSFGIVLWELIAREIPHVCYTPLQAAVGVVQKGLRPTIPKNSHPGLALLLEKCWQQAPEKRPDFSEILDMLGEISKNLDDNSDGCKDKSSGGFFSNFRKGH